VGIDDLLSSLEEAETFLIARNNRDQHKPISLDTAVQLSGILGSELLKKLANKLCHKLTDDEANQALIARSQSRYSLSDLRYPADASALNAINDSKRNIKVSMSVEVWVPHFEVTSLS
jgi:hypothetical protein